MIVTGAKRRVRARFSDALKLWQLLKAHQNPLITTFRTGVSLHVFNSVWKRGREI